MTSPLTDFSTNYYSLSSTITLFFKYSSSYYSRLLFIELLAISFASISQISLGWIAPLTSWYRKSGFFGSLRLKLTSRALRLYCGVVFI
jgi:hypothetical protein